jgi:predicted phage baseplate assembly protein
MQNIVATYRSGIGSDANIDAGALSLLQSRPLGIRGASNPLQAEGGTDAETLEDARRHAPLAVRTLDRVVSLRDFEDFASAFAGIGKAQAVELWSGEHRIVVVTVAADGGGQLAATSVLRSNLVDAIDAARDPWHELRVLGYQPLFFHVAAGLLIDADHERADVESAVADALGAAFSFEARAFGQPAAAAEIVAVAQGVPGVVAVDLDRFSLVTDAGPAPVVPPPVLIARRARWEGASIAPAELLLLNPAGPTLTEMAP